MKRTIREHHVISELLIVCSFFIFASFNAFLLFKYKEIPPFPDIRFHWQRILELLKSSSYFPLYARNTFYNCGSAVMTMYPYLFLYPFVILFRLVHSLTIVSVCILGINTFLSLVISYYSSLKISHSRLVSYLFSVMYSLSFPLFLNVVNSYAIGMNDAFIFLPMVLFGSINWINHGRWLMLSIGMVLLINSEVLITTFTICYLFIWVIINLDKLTLRKILNLLKAVFITSITTAMFWLPVIKILRFNSLKSMRLSVKGVNLLTSIHTAFSLKLMNGYSNTDLLTIYVLIGLISGLILFRSLSRNLRQAYVLSILILLFCSSLFPWKILGKSFLGIVQYPWRFYLIPQVFLTYIFSLFIIKKILIKSPVEKDCILGLILFGILGLQFVSQNHYFKTLGRVYSTNRVILNEPLVVEATDYWPKSSLPLYHSIQKHEGFINSYKHPISMRVTHSNNLRFVTSDKSKKLILPYLHYYGTRYQWYLNHHPVRSSQDSNQLVTLSNVPKGYYSAHVQIKLSKIDIISRILTISGLILYVCTFIRKLYFKIRLRHNL